MDQEHRDAIKAANRSRANCQRCLNIALEIVDGSKVGGMPGIKYKYCNACGWTKAITKRQPKFKL
jgi:hypothetical protein